jgi:hypothetical protein
MRGVPREMAGPRRGVPGLYTPNLQLLEGLDVESVLPPGGVTLLKQQVPDSHIAIGGDSNSDKVLTACLGQLYTKQQWMRSQAGYGPFRTLAVRPADGTPFAIPVGLPTPEQICAGADQVGLGCVALHFSHCLRHSVALFLKRQCDRPGRGPRAGGGGNGAAGRADPRAPAARAALLEPGREELLLPRARRECILEQLRLCGAHRVASDASDAQPPKFQKNSRRFCSEVWCVVDGRCCGVTVRCKPQVRSGSAADFAENAER